MFGRLGKGWGRELALVWKLGEGDTWAFSPTYETQLHYEGEKFLVNVLFFYFFI